MNAPLEFAVSLAALAALAFILLRAYRSPVRPLAIAIEGWGVALGAPRRRASIVVMALLMIGFSDGLQEFFTYEPVLSPRTLLFISIGWQALLSTVLAMVAALYQTSIFDERVRANAMAGPQIKRSRLALLWRAAIIGAALWLIFYVLTIVLRLAVARAPLSFHVFAIRISQLVNFIAGALLSLVRPALAAGDPFPWRSGIKTAIDAGSALLATSAALLIPPLVFGLLAVALVRQLFGVSLFLHVVNDLLIITFSVFQYLASEASTALFFAAAAAVASPAN